MSTNVQPSAPTPASPTAGQPTGGKAPAASTAAFPTSAQPQASTPRTPVSPGSAPANPEAAEGSQYPAAGSSLGTSPAASAATGTATGTATAAVGPNDDGVWSASRPAAEAPVPVSHSRRPGTVAWGVFLAALGGLLIAVGVGIHLDLAQITIGLVAGAGLLLVALAFLPRRKDEQA